MLGKKGGFGVWGLVIIRKSKGPSHVIYDLKKGAPLGYIFHLKTKGPLLLFTT